MLHVRRIGGLLYHPLVERRSWRTGEPLFSERRGEDGPQVVFLHGLGSSSRYWHRTANQLDGHDMQLHLVDLLGFGRSPWPRVAYSIDDHLMALENWGTATDLEDGPVVLVGHSLGALLALTWAARFPRVSALVLIGLPIYPNPDEARHRLANLSLLSRLTLRSRPLAWSACMLMCCLRPLCRLVAPLFSPELPSSVARDGVLHTWRSLSGTLDHCIFGTDFDCWHSQAHRLSAVPLLFVHGRADECAPIDTIRDLVTGMPRARLLEIEAAGHDLPLSHPILLAGLIRNIVQETGPYS